MTDSAATNDSITSEKHLDTPCETTDVGRLHKRLTLNAFSNLLRYFITIVAAFFLTPFVVKTLGNEFYGFWTILLSFVGYAGILEFGVQPGIVKLVAQYRASENMGQINRLLSTAFLFFTTMGTLASIVFVVVLSLFSETLIRNMPSIGHQRLLFAVIGVDVVLVFLMYVFTGLLYGWQKYHAKNVISIAVLIAYASLLVAFLQPGALLTLAVIKTVTDFLALIITVLVCWKVVPGLKLDLRSVTKRSFGDLFSFAGKVFISSTTTRIVTLACPIIIGYWLSMAAVTYFAIANRLVGYSKEIGWSITTGFMPAFSDLASKQDGRLLQDIYTRYSRYTLFATLPTYIYILVLGVPFISIWLGPSYAEAGRTTLYLLIAEAMVRGLQPLLQRFLFGIGNLNVLVLVAVITSLSIIVMSILLVQSMGISGVALSLLIAAVPSQIFMAFYICRCLDFSLFTHLTQVQLRPLLLGVLLYLTTAGLADLVGTGSYLKLFTVALCAGILYVAFVFTLGLDRLEREWTVQKIKAIVG